MLRDVEYRPAGLADLPAIAALQIASWQSAYRGIVSDKFLDEEVPEVLVQRWSAWPGPEWRVETAWLGPDLTGFASVDLDHEGGPYVDNLHVQPGAHGKGIGGALMARAASHALRGGRLWLTVIDVNEKARRFYNGIGGVEGQPRQEHMFSAPVTALPVVWSGDALTALAALA